MPRRQLVRGRVDPGQQVCEAGPASLSYRPGGPWPATGASRAAACGCPSLGNTSTCQIRLGREGWPKLRGMGACEVKPGEVRFTCCSSESPLEGTAAWAEPGWFGSGHYEGESLDLSSTSWLAPERSVLFSCPGEGGWGCQVLSMTRSGPMPRKIQNLLCTIPERP